MHNAPFRLAPCTFPPFGAAFPPGLRTLGLPERGGGGNKSCDYINKLIY